MFKLHIRGKSLGALEEQLLKEKPYRRIVGGNVDC